MSGCLSGQQTLPCGLGVINDGKYAYDVHDRTLFVTALRSPYYANHEPKVVDPQTEDYPVIDRGEQEFTLVLLPHEGGRAVWELDKAAQLLNAPPIIQSEYAHLGRFRASESFLSIEGEGIVLDALKAAEDGSGHMVAHLHDSSRTCTRAALKLNGIGKKIDLYFTPGQIRALKIDPVTGEYVNIDLIENEIGEAK